MLSGIHRYPRQNQVVYGRPASQAVRALAGAYGARRLLIVTTRSLTDGVATRLAEDLDGLAVGVFAGIAAHSPRESVIAAAVEARRVDADLLVALGGGSVIDATKVAQLCLWAGVTTVGELAPYSSAAGPNRVDATKIAAGIPMIAVPTTLSAAEFTDFAAISDLAKRAKEAYIHPDLAPRAVVLDPAVTLATPSELWFSTGLKAVDHAVEQLCTLERAPFGDAVAADGLKRLAAGLPVVQARPHDLDARQECQFGMWMAVSGTASGRDMGASHALGHTLGGSYGVPHGLTSCVVLPAVLCWNKSADGGRQAVVAGLMGSPDTSAAEAVKRLIERLGLPTTLAEVGVGKEHFQAIAEHTMHDAYVRSNPRPITGPADIVEILELARS